MHHIAVYGHVNRVVQALSVSVVHAHLLGFLVSCFLPKCGFSGCIALASEETQITFRLSFEYIESNIFLSTYIPMLNFLCLFLNLLFTTPIKPAISKV